MTTLNVMVANIKSNPRMPTSAVQADIEKLFRWATHREIHANAVFGAEIAFRDYRRAWRRRAKLDGYTSYGLKQECPISVLHGRELHWAVKLLSNGIAKISPNRYCTVVKDPDTRVAYVATHLASRWQDYAAADPDHNERKSLATREIRRIKQRVDRLHRNGWTVVIGGDLNALTRIVWYRGDDVQVLPVEGSNLAKMMQLAVIPAAGCTVEANSHGTYDFGGELHTDHPFRWARFTLTKETR
jgi:hypothetical protein